MKKQIFFDNGYAVYLDSISDIQGDKSVKTHHNVYLKWVSLLYIQWGWFVNILSKRSWHKISTYIISFMHSSRTGKMNPYW